jgi:hypothetical protein
MGAAESRNDAVGRGRNDRTGLHVPRVLISPPTGLVASQFEASPVLLPHFWRGRGEVPPVASFARRTHEFRVSRLARAGGYGVPVFAPGTRNET